MLPQIGIFIVCLISILIYLTGGTDLAKVLIDAIEPDSVDASGARLKPETILIITDGAPDNPTAVEEIIVSATKNARIMRHADDLSISILQVGNDEAAVLWLEQLVPRLQERGAQFDIVDVMHFEDAAHLTDAIRKVFPAN